MNQNNPNPYPNVPPMQPYPPMMHQGQHPYMYPQQGQNPYYPYGEQPKEGKSVWGIVLIVFGVLLTGGIALWWWNKNKKSSEGQKSIRGLYDVQQETISRLNVTIAEQESEIDRLSKLLKVSQQLIDPNNTWSDPKENHWDNQGNNTEQLKSTIDPHIAFRDSFDLDLSVNKNKILYEKMNEAIDWLITKQEFYSVQEVKDQYKNDKSCKVNFSAMGAHILWNERKVFISSEEILNGQFYEKYQAFVREETK